MLTLDTGAVDSGADLLDVGFAMLKAMTTYPSKGVSPVRALKLHFRQVFFSVAERLDPLVHVSHFQCENLQRFACSWFTSLTTCT